jgi:2,4-dienoyl-CoA reductase-like NADH-dependent reductase (Old Yellow Enzyme family)
MSDTEVLFKPFRLKSLVLPNRIVMAPMTRSKSPDQIPNDQVAAYYRARAEGGVGLILTEGTAPEHKSATNDVNVPHFHGEESLKGWAKVVREVKAAGGHIMPQLWHQGVVRHPGTGPYPEAPSMSPSGLARKEKKVAEPMTDADIADVISGFANSARYAKELGFDGVELHGAHGYLIDQFFWEGTNQRDDHFGGPTIAERSKFAAEIIAAVRAAVGPDYPLIIRISQWKQQDFAVRLTSTPDEMQAWLGALVDAGADIIHCSQRRFWEPEFEGSDLNFAGWAKKLTGVPTIAVGSVGLTGEFIASYGGEASKPASLDELLRRLDRGDFDLVGVGRALLQDPQWAVKVHEGRTDELMDFDRSAMMSLS